MDGIKPLLLTFVAWTGAQVSTDAVLTPETAEAVGMIFPILSSALILALVAAAMKYGKLLNKVENKLYNLMFSIESKIILSPAFY